MSFNFERNNTKYDYLPCELPNVIIEVDKGEAYERVAYRGKFATIIPELATEFPHRDFIGVLFLMSDDDEKCPEVYSFCIMEKGHHVGTIRAEGDSLYISSPSIDRKLETKRFRSTRNVEVFKKLFRKELRVQTQYERLKRIRDQVVDQIAADVRTYHMVCSNLTKELLEVNDLARVIITHMDDVLQPEVRRTFEQYISMQVADKLKATPNQHVVVCNEDSTYTMISIDDMERIDCTNDQLPAYVRRKMGMIKLIQGSGRLECGSFKPPLDEEVYFITEEKAND